MSIDNHSTIGQRVRAMREARGLSQEQLAKRAGLRQPTISNIETDRTKPQNIKASTLMRIAAVLDTNPDYLRTGRGAKAPTLPQGTAADLMGLYEQLTDEHRAALVATAKALLGTQN